MEENKKSQLDAFLKKQVQELPLESPSKDFTASIMDVLSKEKSTVTKYVPLISKKVWLLIAAAVVAIFFIPFQKQEGGLLEQISIDFSFLDKISFSGLTNALSVSNTAFYGILLFSIMVFAQIIYLKGYFNRKIS